MSAYEVARRLVAGNWKTVIAEEDGGGAGEGPTIISAHVTYDMEGLIGATDPPEPGIRLGTYVIPAGSLVVATVIPEIEWLGFPFNLMYPLLRSTDGLTSSPLVDAGIISPTITEEGIRGSTDMERPWLTTEECHLGVGVTASPMTWGTLNAGIDDSQTAFQVDAAQDPPLAGFTIQIDDEQMTLVEPAPSGSHPRTFTVIRGVNGTSAAAHNQAADVGCIASAGSSYIAFWVFPLIGDLPS